MGSAVSTVALDFDRNCGNGSGAHMADESDVENVIASLVSGFLYPNGLSQPSIAGVPVTVFRGYPTTQQQERAKAQSKVATQTMAAGPGLVNVSVSARNGVERNTSRLPLANSLTTIQPVHTITASVSGRAITIGGTVAIPQNVIAFIGGHADVQAISYAVQASDTLTSIATGLATLINSSFPGTTSTGAAVTVNSPLPLSARVSSQGTIVQIVGQQEKSFPDFDLGASMQHHRPRCRRLAHCGCRDH